MNKFQVILADPPWQYRDKCNAGKRGAAHKYDVLNLEEIKALDVQKISAENSALFLWATAPMLPDAISVIEAWGFKFKTVAFVWFKKNKVADTPFWGMGNYTRANAEFCLLGTKGKPERKSAAVHSIIEAKVREHSRKPDEQYKKIRELFGDVPSVELFARHSVRNFVLLGNEIDGQDIREVLRK